MIFRVVSEVLDVFKKMIEQKFTELEPYQRDLVLKAEAAMENAYNLFSHFLVGAAVLTKDGKIYVGTNAENSSAGLTICAERAAILTANTDGERYFKAIAVIGKHEDFAVETPVAPCGACRQFIYDFSQISKSDIEIIYSNTNKDRIRIRTIEELLPDAFGPESCGQDISRFRK